MKSLKLISSAIAMLICFVAVAQERTITGTVTDESNLPLPGVQIIIKGTKKNTQTDYDGKYSIQAQKGDALIFSYVGMDSQTIFVKTSNVINVILKNNSLQLQEVVTIGYGTSNSESEDRSYARAERKKAKMKTAEMAQGRVAGIQVQNNIGYLASPTVAIREIASIPAKNEPLYIVDGIPVKADQFAKINPNDVQDVKVLKDKDATATYGNKASNGVVVIDTKNGIYKNLTEKELDAKLNILYPTPPVTPNQEDYDTFVENAFESPKTAPLSTFSIDVDNASYTNIRRFINNGQAVPKDAVRVEEMVNFFKYNYPQPKDQHPFSINTELSDSPWNSKNQILRIGLQGKKYCNREFTGFKHGFLN